MTQVNKNEVVAASFVSAFYNTLVSAPVEIQKYYNATAEVTHFGNRSNLAVACRSLPKQLQEKLEGQLRQVEIETIAVTAHGESGIRITVEGSFMSSTKNQRSNFRQVFELLEVAPACYGVASDALTDSIHPTTTTSSSAPAEASKSHEANATKDTQLVKERLSWADTPPMFQQKANTAPAPEDKIALPSNTTVKEALPPSSSSAAPTASKPAPAAPTNFAEALRMKAQAAPATTTIVRASDKKEAEPESKDEKNKDNKRGKDGPKGKRAPASQQKSKNQAGSSNNNDNNSKNNNSKPNKNKGPNSDAKKNGAKE